MSSIETSRLGRAPLPLLRALIRKFSIAWLLKRFPERIVWAVFMFINGFITTAILAAIAMITRTPFVFPSLGPTAFMFFYAPESATASPRQTIYGHAIGILCGFGSLWVCGLTHALPTIEVGVSPARVLAAALSLASTGAFMILFRAAHPPAGATTLIISLGIISRPFDLVLIEAAVALLTLQVIVINRLAGLNYPLWARRDEAHH
jgi:CBS-domain-containing membrane protein